MSFISSFTNLDKRFAWSFLGFMLAAIFGGITIYTEFYRVDNPELVVEILNDTNVLDVKEDVNELKIFYGDVDIKSLNQTLSVLFLRVKNDGGAPILNGYYDNKYPLNIALKDGKFLKAEQTSSTNNYLKTSALPTINSEKTILLPNIILEQGESYTIKILTLHSADSDVEINVLGKIAGVRNIRLSKNNDTEEEMSYWGKVFFGDAWVQLVRFPIYFFGFILLIGLTVAPIASASDYFTKRKRKNIITQYKAYENDKITEKHKLLFEAYVEDGLAPIAETKEILSDKEKLKKIVIKGKSERRRPSDRHPDRLDERHSRDPRRYYRRATIYRLLNSIEGFSENENNEIISNPNIEKLLGKFIDFVVIKES